MDTYGLPAGWLASVCNVDASTARRWKRQGRAPSRYRRLIELAGGADLGALSPAWRGWSLRDGRLFNPEGEGFLADQVRALHLNAQLIAELQRRLARIMEAAPAPRARELIFRVRLDDELQVMSSGVETLAHLEPLAAS